jgi:RimJ/RimL family protein N-acetyltransferase
MPQEMKSYDPVVKYYEKEIEREDRMHYIIELRDSKEAIGTAVIRLNKWGNVRRGNIGTYLDKNYWNKGLGKIITLALLEISFYYLNLEKCEACSIEYNKRAHKVLEDCGFKRYGIERKSMFVLGRKWDWYCFDILREEYLQIREELLRKFLGEYYEEYKRKINVI